ncbi:MAG TPA: alpha/beta fold hydrolase [Polyangia bacterium]
MSLPGSFVPTPAGRVFVHRGGKPGGAPLVLIHGWMMTHWYFRPLLDALGGERELFAIDLPGFGESDRPSRAAFGYDAGSFADIVAATLDTLGVARADVLGHSMGGGVAVALAARHPERVQRLVAVAAAVYRLELTTPLAKLALLPVVGRHLARVGLTRRSFARACRAESVRDGRCLDDEWIDYFWARLERPGGHDAAHTCLTVLTSAADNNGDPGRVRAPTLLVWGDEDRLVPLGHGKRLARAIAGARLEVVPASGHMPFIERTEEFLRVLRPFLAAPASPLVETPIPPRRAHSVTAP